MKSIADLSEDISRSDGVQDELLRHLLGKMIDRSPTGAVCGDDVIRAEFFHLPYGRANDRFHHRPGKMKPAENGMNFRCPVTFWACFTVLMIPA